MNTKSFLGVVASRMMVCMPRICSTCGGGLKLGWLGGWVGVKEGVQGAHTKMLQIHLEINVLHGAWQQREGWLCVTWCHASYTEGEVQAPLTNLLAAAAALLSHLEV
jgi:hypothetical protein